MKRQQHWDQRYGATPVERLGWYRTHLERSLAWIDELSLPRDAAIIDVGAGASTLVDDLLDRGFTAITALDVSEQALAIARRRLGERSALVDWHIADITSVDLPEASFDLWHDRAVFHFLTDAGDRALYRRALERSLRPSGYLLIGVFSHHAPPRCSGLPVQRYSLEQLRAEFGPGFDLIADRSEPHVTPGGVEQPYVYALLQRRADGAC